MGQTPKFTHLHFHTEYSFLDGIGKVKDLAKAIKDCGMDSVAVTDHGNMFGAIEFYKVMRKEGIKPILGIETYLHNAEDLSDKNPQRFHLCLYAKNLEGYQNLMYLSSQAFLHGFHSKPRINKKILRERSAGLVCSSACLSGEVQWHLNAKINDGKGRGGYERAKEVALEYKDIFGDDFYLELMRHGIEDQEYIDKQILRLSFETGIKIIATNDTHYIKQADAKAQDVASCIGFGRKINDPDRKPHTVYEFYIKTPEEMAKLYADLPEALENTQEIVNKCNLELHLGNPTPPSFKFTAEYAKRENLPYTQDSEYFMHKCREGLKKRLLDVEKHKHKEYEERLEYEMEVINKMKFPGYMLIVWDFVRAAKERGIPVGPGRGSAAGSLVAFCLEITDIDPLKYDLLFERFLNPERVSMPDIDMDFCQARRQEILDYMSEKYGQYNVAQVATFGQMKARAVIRDVARVMEMPYSDADNFAKLIPKQTDITLKEAFEQEPKIADLIQRNALAKKVWDFALSLEDTKRQAGIHAAAVVIDSEHELWHKAPLYVSQRDNIVAVQYYKDLLEDVDLIKFDFLGLNTLTAINHALELIKKQHGVKLDFLKVDLNDKKVYETLQGGNTIGIFQIESRMFQEMNRRIQPNQFEDIIATIALGRPGPMKSGMVDDFINRKHGKEPIVYMFPELEPILRSTYGTIVYQEQVMQIVQRIGGFSLGEADLIRRAMGKKNEKIMADNKVRFVEGAQKQGFNKKKSEELWDLIVKFAGYGFNKSHSAAYAMITFETAYLKTYYPVEFMAALLTSEKSNSKKVAEYVGDAKRMGIKVLPPDVKKSELEFATMKNNGESCILFGLGAIKGAGEVAIDMLLSLRKIDESGRDFDKTKSLEDFLSSINPTVVNKKSLEAFIKSGAMDCFGYSRKTLLQQVESLTEYAKRARDIKEQDKDSLFAAYFDCYDTLPKLELEDLGEFSQAEILEFEKESLGFYVSGHPLDSYREILDEIDYVESKCSIEEVQEGSKMLIVGLIEDVSVKTSRSGKRYGTLKIQDFYGSLELTIFEQILAQVECLDKRIPIAVKCLVQEQNDHKSLKAEKILSLEEAKNEKTDVSFIEAERGLILLLDDELPVGMMQKLRLSAMENSGDRVFKIVFKTKTQELEMVSDFRVSPSFKQHFNELQWREY